MLYENGGTDALELVGYEVLAPQPTWMSTTSLPLAIKDDDEDEELAELELVQSPTRAAAASHRDRILSARWGRTCSEQIEE